MRLTRALALSGAILTPAGAATDTGRLTVSLVPSETLYAWEEGYAAFDGERSQADLVLQGIAIHNRSDEPCSLSHLLLEAFRDAEPVLTERLPRSLLERRAPFASRVVGAGLRGILDLSFGSDALPDPSVPFAESPDVPPGALLLLTGTRLWPPVLPDRLQVTAECEGDADARRASASVAVRRYETRNEYGFPLAGRWLQIASPSAVRDHHRYNLLTEFGVDLLRPEIGDDRGAPAEAPGFGATVLAAADGEVVSVHRSATTLAPREGESPEDFAGRLRAAMREALEGDFLAFSAGNHVVLRHPGSEYSFYGHLREGGVLVDAGQRVRRGDPIGEVGGTGETAYVHLHFQVWDAPPGRGARSLPFRFVDAVEDPFEPGYVIGATSP